MSTPQNDTPATNHTDTELDLFQAARQRGVFLPFPALCDTWLATKLRLEEWRARAAEMTVRTEIVHAETMMNKLQRLQVPQAKHMAALCAQSVREPGSFHAAPSAEQERDMLKKVIAVVRQYPDFDNENHPLSAMMDQALAGQYPTMLDSIDGLASDPAP